MKTLIIILLMVYCTGISAQGFQWAITSNGTLGDRAYDIAIDDLGNIFLAVECSGTISVSGTVITCAGTDALILKLNTSGSLLWYRAIGGTGTANAYSISLDDQKNIYVTGQFSGVGIFGTFSFTASGPSDMYVAKLDSAGYFKWVATSSGPESGVGVGVATDRAGNVYVTGDLSSGEILGPDTAFTTFNNPPTVFFLAKYNSSGNLIWNKMAEASDGSDVEVDQFGGVYTSGNYYDTIMFPGNIQAIHRGGSSGDIFVAKTDNSGNFLWVKTFGGTGSDDANNMKIDRQGNIYLAGSSGSAFLLKLDNEGNYLWQKDISGSGTRTAIDVDLDLDGNVYVAGQFSDDLNFNTNGIDTFYTIGTNDAFLAKCKPDGAFEWATAAQSLNSTSSSVGFGIAVNKLGNVYLTGEFKDSVSFGGTLITNGGIDNFYLARTFTSGNSISGVVYDDADSNGIRDTGEKGIEGVIVEVLPGPLYFLTNAEGQYAAYVGSGSYSISIPNPPIYHTMVTTSHSASFIGTGLSDTDNDFGLFAVIPPDLRITMTNTGAARPGFDLTYRLTYSNLGTSAMSGSVVLNSDNVLVYLSSTPQGSNAGNITTWAFANLEPGQTRNVNVTFNIPTATVRGAQLTSSVTINPVTGDNTTTDNTSTVTQTVTGSVDPNDKQVEPSGNITPAQVANGDFFTYTIRFQNTGNDTAFNIYIRDTLDQNLYIPSFKMLSASHPYSVRMFGSGIVEWSFQNVLLPDSNINETASHGFIKYRVEPKQTLTLGSTIVNLAAIYFDFNDPVLTNTTVNTVSVWGTGIVNAEQGFEMNVYPNPTTGRFYLEFTVKENTTANIKLLNCLGENIQDEIYNLNPGSTSLDFELSPTPGVYFLKMQVEAKEIFRKLILY